MTGNVPLAFRWDAETDVMRPAGGYFVARCAERFRHGETYRLIEHEERSMASHRHFFACLNEAWSNLSEEDADRFPSPEHLRKWALTYTPFCDVRVYHAKSRAEAMRVAKYVKGEYERVEIDGTDVRHYIPRSQAMDAMSGNRIFQQSKSAVLDVLARKLNITVGELEEAGRKTA